VEEQALDVLLTARESLRVCIGGITKAFNGIITACDNVLARDDPLPRDPVMTLLERHQH
jgi:hypothetical protein